MADVRGNAFALAKWFTQATDVSGTGAEEFVREAAIADIYQATRYGVSGDVVIVDCPNGRAIIERKEVQGCPLVLFDYVKKGEWVKLHFWFNASSVSDLGDHLRCYAQRVTFDEVFINE